MARGRMIKSGTNFIISDDSFSGSARLSALDGGREMIGIVALVEADWKRKRVVVVMRSRKESSTIKVLDGVTDGGLGVGRGLEPNGNTVLVGEIGCGFEFGSKQVHALITLPRSKMRGKSGTRSC